MTKGWISNRKNVEMVHQRYIRGGAADKAEAWHVRVRLGGSGRGLTFSATTAGAARSSLFSLCMQTNSTRDFVGGISVSPQWT